jgi:hypothetical protein
MICLTAYHGTQAEFTKLENDHPSPSGLAAGGAGLYFWEDFRLAEPFAGEDGRVIKAEITLHNPAIMQSSQTPGQEARRAEARAFSDQLRAAGHDGLIIEHAHSGREIVVFDPACIRVTDAAMSLADRSAARQR